MSKTDLERFYAIAAYDLALLDRLLSGVKTPDEFVTRAVAAAAHHGLEIDPVEARQWLEQAVAHRPVNDSIEC